MARLAELDGTGSVLSHSDLLVGAQSTRKRASLRSRRGTGT